MDGLAGEHSATITHILKAIRSGRLMTPEDQPAVEEAQAAGLVDIDDRGMVRLNARGRHLTDGIA